MARWRNVARQAVNWSAAVAAGLAAVSATAQQMAPHADIVNRGANRIDPENDAKDTNDGVYPPESNTAVDNLVKVQSLERQNAWAKAASFYDDLLTKPEFAGKVIPSRQNGQRQISQYTSIESLVMQRLAKWPDEGLEVYRAMYESPASSLLASAGPDDLFTLRQVFSRYFVTDSGAAAGIRLMDDYLAAGEFRAAAAVGKRLLEWHPRLLAERAGVLYRTAIALHLSGDDADAQRYLSELQKHDPQAKGTVRGRDVILADSLADELKRALPTASGSTADSYTTFGGNAARDRVLAVSNSPGAHLYSVALSKPMRPNAGPAMAYEGRYKKQLEDGLTLGVMPVVDRGELFFQDGQRIYGINLESGVPLPGWQQSHGPDHDGAYTLPNATGSPRSCQLTVTVTDQAVLAVMGQPDLNMLRAGIPQQGETRLVCLDRRSGKEKWVAAPSQFEQSQTVAFKGLKSVQFSGAPLVVGENVLVAATESKNAGFEDCYVLCLDLSSGAPRWAANVATASTATLGWMGMNPNAAGPENEIHLAYANGRVFVQTNRGAVAALDAYNGTIDWLDVYPRGRSAAGGGQVNPMFFQQPQLPENQTKPWTYNPTIVSQGMVFTLPLEGKTLLIFDAATGAEFKRIDLGDLAQRLKNGDTPDREEFDTLAGVVGDKLILVGSRAVVALNWKTYDGDHFDDQKMLFWDGFYPQQARGRAFLAQQSLYLPMEDRLYQLNLTTGKTDKVYPNWPRTWGEDEGPGNVLATSDHLVIAGAERVDVYTDLSAAKAKLDREVAEAPEDPQPRLRYAEVMYAAGDYDTSLIKLDEAIERAGGAHSMRPGPVRDRIFADALSFARKLKADSRAETLSRVAKMFDRAALAAGSPEQQVQYRMLRARFDESQNRMPEALALYQEVLGDAAMRSVAVPDESSSAPASADVVAQKRIAALIRRDPQLYAPYEERAADALRQAQATRDPARLLEIAEAYPNSAVAAKSMLAAADAYQSAGDTPAARRVLFQVYTEGDASSPARPQVMEDLARLDLLTPGKDGAAAKLLAEGVQSQRDPKLIKPLRFPDGTEIASGTAFSAALDAVRKFSFHEQDRTLPVIALPVPREGEPYPKPFAATSPVLSDVAALAVPLQNFARADRFVTWSAPTRLSIYPAGGDKPLATADALQQPPAGSAWMDKDLLVWGATQVSLLRDEGRAAGWSLDVARLASIEVIAPPADPVADANNAPANDPVQLAMQRRGRVIVNAGGRMIVRNGAVVMPGAAPAAKAVPAGPEQIDKVRPVGSRVLVSTSAGRLMCVDRASGRIAWQTRLTDRPLDRLLGDEDFTVLLVEDETTVRLAVLDTFTGHVRGIKTFQRDSNSFPQNVALSPDGTLVYTLPDRICIKDLYQAWDHKLIERAAPPSQATFSGLTEADQLIVSEGRILALSDSGNAEHTSEKFIRLYSLQTGDPIMLKFGDGQQVEQALSVGTKSSHASLRVIGPRVYAIAPDAAVFYNLDNPADHYAMFDEETGGIDVRRSFIGRDYLLLLSAGDGTAPPANAPDPAAPAPDTAPLYTLYAFSRATVKGRESEKLIYSTPIADPAGITAAWQAIDGGLVYLTADHKLHMLVAAK